MKKSLTLMLVFSALLNAQNSFYSSYGFGVESPSVSVRMMGMGGAGAAVSDTIVLNSMNPALWTNFYTTSLQGQINTSVLNVPDTQFTNHVTRFEGFAFKFPIGKRIGVALGMAPKTRSNGSISFVDSAQLSVSKEWVKYRTILEVLGGVSEVYAGAGYRINSAWALGAKMQFLFGTYTVKSETDFHLDDDYDSFFKKETSLSGSQLGIGILWSNWKHALNISGYYEHFLSFGFERYYDYSYGPDSTGKVVSLRYPSSLRLAVNKKVFKNTDVNLDFRFTKVDHSLFKTFYLFEPVDAKDPIYIGVGIEKRTSPIYSKKLWNQLSFRGGAYYKTEPFYHFGLCKETGVTLGLGIPFNRNLNRLDFALGFGNRSGFLNKKIGKEKILDFHLSVTTGEIWFFRFSRR